MKHSHLLNVRDIKNYKGGGYFVGLLYEPKTCKEILDQAKDFVWRSGNKYKIFTNPLTVKIKNHTSPKSVTLNEDGHIVINENKPDNGRLVDEALKK